MAFQKFFNVIILSSTPLAQFALLSSQLTSPHVSIFCLHNTHSLSFLSLGLLPRPWSQYFLITPSNKCTSEYLEIEFTNKRKYEAFVFLSMGCHTQYKTFISSIKIPFLIKAFQKW